MSELDFAYVGLGVHEEVVYPVADELGYYADEGVRVSIRDGVRWDDQRLRQAAVVGLGRTLLIRLLAGTPWTMLCVNTERPLFWLMARAEFADVSSCAAAGWRCTLRWSRRAASRASSCVAADSTRTPTSRPSRCIPATTASTSGC